MGIHDAFNASLTDFQKRIMSTIPTIKNLAGYANGGLDQSVVQKLPIKIRDAVYPSPAVPPRNVLQPAKVRDSLY